MVYYKHFFLPEMLTTISYPARILHSLGLNAEVAANAWLILGSQFVGVTLV